LEYQEHKIPIKEVVKATYLLTLNVKITTDEKGNQGFGYDSIFKPSGFEQTFAEMNLALKNSIGHRGKAVAQLVRFLNN